MVKWFEQQPRNQRHRGPFWYPHTPTPVKKALPVMALLSVLIIIGAGAVVGLMLQNYLPGRTSVAVGQALYIDPEKFDENDIAPAGRNGLVTVSDDGSAFGLHLEVSGGDLYTIRLPLSNRGQQDMVVELNLPWAHVTPGFPISVDVLGLYWFVDANDNQLYDYGEALVLSNDGLLDPGDEVVKAGYAPFGNYTAGLYYLDNDHDGNYTAGEVLLDQNGGNYSNLLEPGDTVFTAGSADLMKFTAVSVGPTTFRMLVPAAIDPIEYLIVLAFADNTPTGFYKLSATLRPTNAGSGLEQLVKEPLGHNYGVEPGPTQTRYVGHDRAPDGGLVLRTAGTDLRLDLGDMARGQTFTYTAALGIVNEGTLPTEVTGIQVTGEGARYMRVYLHDMANLMATADSSGVLIWNGSAGEQSFTWELAAGNEDVTDMWSHDTPFYGPSGVRALSPPWLSDAAADSDHVWVQVEVSVPQDVQNGLYSGTIHFDFTE